MTIYTLLESLTTIRHTATSIHFNTQHTASEGVSPSWSPQCGVWTDLFEHLHLNGCELVQLLQRPRGLRVELQQHRHLEGGRLQRVPENGQIMVVGDDAELGFRAPSQYYMVHMDKKGGSIIFNIETQNMVGVENNIVFKRVRT